MRLQNCVTFFDRDRKVGHRFYTAKLRRRNRLIKSIKKEVDHGTRKK